MTYIIVTAGLATRLHPHTLRYPKALFQLDADTTLLLRLVSGIRRHDPEAEIVVCTGFYGDLVAKAVPDAIIVHNPFYAVTNSLATLWFAREYLDREQVVLIDGDILAEERLIAEVYTKPVDRPTALIDTSRADSGDYCVQLDGRGLVSAMAKNLPSPSGEYANVTLLDGPSARLYAKKMEDMIAQGLYDQWMETALMQLIFEDGFALYHRDIAGYRWSEVDDVSELAAARDIHAKDR